jgi:hypothetical protein
MLASPSGGSGTNVHRVLAAHGFTMAQADNSVFYKSNCVVYVYVDDFPVAPANDDEIQHVPSALETEFRLGRPKNPTLVAQNPLRL